MKRTLLTLFCTLLALAASADEGMWLPSLISQRIDDMRAKGFRLTAEDIYSINKASMKDAVVLFNGGCTGELISSEGMLLTNHHCGYDAIQAHSSVEHDYLTNGFWAMSRREELPNKELNVRFLVRMEEVTDRIAAGETKAEIIRRAEAESKGYKASVEQMYYGNQQFLFIYEQFDDVRLVGRAALVDRQVRRRHRQLDMAPPHGRLLALPHLRRQGQQARRLLARERSLPPQAAFHHLDRRGRRGGFHDDLRLPRQYAGVHPLGRRGLHRRALRPGQDRHPHGAPRHHLRGTGERPGAAHPLRRQTRLDRQRMEEMAGRGAGHRPPGHRGLETRL